MRTREFLSRLDHERIAGAITAAETRTSGEIRVFVQRGKLKEEALPLAERKFQQLGMQKTRDRNGVLIFVAPRAHQFAVVGDQGVHKQCGAEFWQQLVDRMRAHFRDEDFTEGLLHAISATSDLLARYFPRKPDDVNELPDQVLEG
jgi:uncharacterized membrane protein